MAPLQMVMGPVKGPKTKTGSGEGRKQIAQLTQIVHCCAFFVPVNIILTFIGNVMLILHSKNFLIFYSNTSLLKLINERNNYLFSW
jgi:hypothetical protein